MQLGASNGDTTAILSGLKKGWQVVLGNQLNLVNGMALVDADAPQTAVMPKMSMPGMKMPMDNGDVSMPKSTFKAAS